MIELSVDEVGDGLRAVARAVAAEADGKQLKRELAAELRKIAEPLRQRQIQRLMAIPSKGHPGQGLRDSVARQTKAGVRFSGRNVGVHIQQRARGMPRNFRFAGRALNRAEGWQPQALGGVRIQQFARPVEWFDQPTRGVEADFVRAVHGVIENMARRLAARASR